MTLVVVGHDFEESWPFLWEGSEAVKGTMKPAGLFVVADSAITSPNSGQTLLGGFRKVYPIAIKLWKPYFLGRYFRSYQTTHLETECFVAIAGSTLTAQHIINSINEHLGSLRITFFQNEAWGRPGLYKMVMDCEENPLLKNPGVDEWEEDMFLPSDFGKVLTAAEISRVVHHAVNAALASAKKYKLDEQSLKAMTTDIALGVTCPVNGTEYLFSYRMKWEVGTAGIKVFAEMQEIKSDQVAVLGMRRFEERAQATFDGAVGGNVSPAVPLFEFLNSAIDEVNADGGFEIDRPSYLKLYRGGKLTHVSVRQKE